LRFLGVIGDLSDEALTYLTDVDQDSHVALVATVTSPDLKTERGVGVARFIRTKEARDVAEAAITVIDDMQHKGVGTALAHELERIARARGVRAIRADVLDANEAMRSILEAAGARRVDGGGDPGVTTYEVTLEAKEGPLAKLLRVISRGRGNERGERA
jgi:GNAT superfamily N-acetyltransferase